MEIENVTIPLGPNPHTFVIKFNRKGRVLYYDAGERRSILEIIHIELAKMLETSHVNIVRQTRGLDPDRRETDWYFFIGSDISPGNWIIDKLLASDGVREINELIKREDEIAAPIRAEQFTFYYLNEKLIEPE